MLLPYEAAFILRTSQEDVRRRLRRGELASAWRGRRLCFWAAELEYLAADDALALELLRAIRAGEIEAPRNFSPKLAAPSLVEGARRLVGRIIAGASVFAPAFGMVAEPPNAEAGFGSAADRSSERSDERYARGGGVLGGLSLRISGPVRAA